MLETPGSTEILLVVTVFLILGIFALTGSEEMARVMLVGLCGAAGVYALACLSTCSPRRGRLIARRLLAFAWVADVVLALRLPGSLPTPDAGSILGVLLYRSTLAFWIAVLRRLPSLSLSPDERQCGAH